RSMRWKMVGVFIAISVIPMLVATDVTTEIVETAFRRNVEAWLFQTSQFFLANILAEQKETAQVADSLIAEGKLDKLVSGNARNLPLSVEQISDALGYDLVVIFDENNQVVFTSRPLGSFMGVPFADKQTVYLYKAGGQPTLIAAGTQPLVVAGRRYHVLLGTLIDQSFTSSMSAMTSLVIRMSYKVDGTFMQVYASRQEPEMPVPADVVTVLTQDAGSDFVPGDFVSPAVPGEGGTASIYAPIRANGELIGIVFCGLSSNAGLVWSLTRQNLFAGIFAFGMLLSIGAGLILSRFLTRPVVRLAEGVNAIAKGDFTQRVPVRAQDELGQLAMAFNAMAQELEGLRKMEAKLRRRERMTTLGEVAAGLAHEVRNPLGIIKASAELLERSPNLSEVERRRLGYVADEVRRINMLIRNFLVFAKPPQNMVDVAPIKLVERVLAVSQSEIERHQVDVTVRDESAGAQVRLDFDQMVQACLNLVLNALQAMEEKTLAASAPESPVRGRLGISICTDAEGVHLSFADTGPGVPPHLLDRIFEPFVTTKDSGTGLGLARVFAVAEGHGGFVEVRNQPDGGAVFKMVLPLSNRRSDDVPHNPDR
nr:HAMP domain-containing protein [Hyphomicrobium zavarzinii]